MHQHGRAAVEGVPETVIAAIYLLHDNSVDAVASKLTPGELGHVIRLVGRCPSYYPPGTLDALKQRRALVLPEPPHRSSESPCRDVAAEKQHAGTPCAQHTVTRGADPRGQLETCTTARSDAGVG